MKIASQKINEQNIDIEVNNAGTFSATFDDQDFSGKTMEELVDKLKKATTKAREQGLVDVSIVGMVLADKSKRSGWSTDGPYDIGIGVIHARLRGQHAREHNTYLLVSEDGQKFKLTGSRSGQISRRMTVAEVSEYMRLAEAKRVATTNLEDFVGAVKLNPDDALAGARKQSV